MRIFSKGTYRLITAVLLTSMLLLLPALAVVQNEENPEVSRLLSAAREKAAALSRDADEMEALTRSAVSWESHATMLETMKEDVNDLAKIGGETQCHARFCLLVAAAGNRPHAAADEGSGF